MIESHFNNIDKVISHIILESKKTVDIATAWFTHKGLMQLIQSHALLNLVKFRIIISDDEINQSLLKDYNRLIEAGIDLMIYNGESKWNLMHNKFAIIDSEIVITGSYNWTKSADSNIENIVVCRDNTQFASKYSVEFERIFKLSHNHKLKDSESIGDTRLQILTEEQIWSLIHAFHEKKYNPTVQRVWRAMKGTKSKSIKQKTSELPLFNTIEKYNNPCIVLKELKRFFTKYEKEIAEEFQYEERGWNNIAFPGSMIYSFFDEDTMVKIESIKINKEKLGQKWSNQELILLSNYILKTNDTKVLSKLLNRKESSVVAKTKRILYNNRKLNEEWLKILNTYT